MRKNLISSCAIAAVAFAGSADAALIITGVVDGGLSGGTPKAIELYSNGTTDLSQYAIGSANNGGGTDGAEFTLSGTASDGEYIYISSEATNFEAFFGFATDFTTGAAGINGDDAIELFFDSTGDFTGGEVVVDIFGDINVDGNGEVWEYMDGWAYRVDETGPDGSTFVSSNFTYSGANALDGITSNDVAGVPFGTFVIPEPASLALIGLGGLAMLGRGRRQA